MKVFKFFCYGLAARLAVAFSFGSRSQKDTVTTSPRYDLDINLSEMLQSGSRLSNIYSTALSELQDLESEPLCHRVAARLLILNCQLLDGKDEATILTDSGRQVRDFVDAYAASMAICDLERGRFKIPTKCQKFREPALAQLSLGDQAKLHVNSREIDLCLSGLGEDSSAWSTWVSYRHKALRFCEAARADQEKAQNILLYQRVTKVMAKLTHSVEIELQRYMDDLELRVQNAADAVQSMEPEFEKLRTKLAAIDKYVTQDLDYAVKRSGDSINDGLKNAGQLQHILAAMVQTALDVNSHFAAAQGNSIALVERREADLDDWAAVMSMATASAQALNSQIQLSRLGMEADSWRQNTLSMNLERLTATTDDLLSKCEEHAFAITEAKNMTNEILEMLESVAGTAAVIEEAERSRWRDSGLGGWMPYIVSPATTLFLGSYGLAPSAVRNLCLVALGEIIGFSMTNINRITMPWTTMVGQFDRVAANTTVSTL
ncbi:hypothetical protein N0V93_002451 [Gnomoniopsis smithogilvyi]|uniref:Karyogamy protein 5 n=1 Tax=Gnomoniopsis smithogilvyi TaxID=1191159 RepID=A0A9W8YXL8_9PEZI|nr:hypothetical protein N0V93_002451 [Gnomoniopsis smithogilvyi]